VHSRAEVSMPEFLLAIATPPTLAQWFSPPPADWDFAVRTSPTAGDALAHLDSEADCRLVVVERDVEPQYGRLVQRLRKQAPGLEVLLLSPPVSEAVRAELAATHVDLLDRTAAPADVAAEIRRRFRRASLQARAGIVGHSRPILEILETVMQIGPADIPVLLTGPSGAGKERVARAVYLASPRVARPFIALNVGALAESVLESELFGHEKGAFTGAVARKEGVFERADGGTLFLDEVGEMSPHMQVRLLRALDSGEITPVGGTRSLRVDVRLVAATNRSLEDAVRRGEFREDLYYRLKVVHIEVPSLASRRGDIPELVQHFLEESARLYGTVARRVSEPALQSLVAYDWPGNIRELRNVVHSMAVLAKGPSLEAGDLPPLVRGATATENLPMVVHRTPEQAERDVILTSLLALRRDIQEVLTLLRGTPPPSRAVVVEAAPAGAAPGTPSLRESERDLIAQALAAEGGNRRRAARRLGVAERTLYRKLKAYGLS
jgi:DNA-binding NtrC family response regulator